MRINAFVMATFMSLAPLFSACGNDEPTKLPELRPQEPSTPGEETPTPPVTPVNSDKLVVGYYPTWGTWWGEPDYDKMSIICLAFSLMKGDGNLYYDDAKALKSTIQKAHDKDVKVLISLRDADNVSKALADPTLRAHLAQDVKKCIDELGLDGVDVDYEEWGGDEGAKRTNLEEFYKDIRKEIGQDKLLTAAVGGKTHEDPSTDAALLSHLDYVFPMIYDQCGGWEGGGWGQVGQHSSYEYFVDVVNFYTNTLKVPKEKLCPGVPFYGYQFKSATSVDGAVSIAYRDVLDKYPDTDAHLTDNMGLIWYNGLNTIGKKAQYVVDQDLGGIMIWELTQDTKAADKSLLNKINATMGSPKK